MLPQPRIRLLHALNQILRGLVERIRVLIPPFADDHAVRHSARRNACSRPNGDSIRILAAHWFPVVRIYNAYRPLPELPEIAARPHVLYPPLYIMIAPTAPACASSCREYFKLRMPPAYCAPIFASVPAVPPSTAPRRPPTIPATPCVIPDFCISLI